MSSSPPLHELLKERFHFDEFRPKQEAICQAVADGRDSLVVMPTGAGKSLCYQLPGLARGKRSGRPTLIISPLVALIEDQVLRLQSRGLKADRIHSGRGRENSREAFRAYLRGEIEFLFIAPERLGVPGFPEMLRNNPPALIAVDEAHCISQWGHDFRPDYRLVGERLHGIADTPIVALTATATPEVQEDICKQLRLRDPRKFIHGFRRDNLVVRAVDLLPSDRLDRIAELLAPAERRPAIVYAPTRKKAEEIAETLSRKIHCSAYHAGLTPAQRDRVQGEFLSGQLDVIVATIAFGMGIDKADVRTVIHAALPASIEGYYQEIGRAGRDGKISDAYLMHGLGDRKTHEFFLERDYPESALLGKIRHQVPRTGSTPLSFLREQFQSTEPEAFEKAVEKLWLHGGVEIDPEENVSLGTDAWLAPYEAQRSHRLKQLQSMQDFARGGGCRMVRLVRHFGDPTDAGGDCGLCDRCAPGFDGHQSRTLDARELVIAKGVLASLAGRDGQAAGRLFEDEAQGASRSGFERVISALERAQLIDVSQESFEKDGKTIAFRRVSLTRIGRSVKGAALAEVEIEGPGLAAGESAPRKRGKSRPSVAARFTPTTQNISSEAPKLFESLRSWRLEEARKRGIPAFRILSDRVLWAICEQQPSSEDELITVPGVGTRVARQYGQELLARISSGR